MQYAMPFIIAMLVAMAGLPLLVKLAAKWGIVDAPGVRKVHCSPMPRVGGLAMAIGVFVAALITIDLQGQDRWFLAAAAVLIAVGGLDDRYDLDYRAKLLGQLLAVGMVIIAGNVRIHDITLDDRLMLPEWISMPLTFLFLVGITNAINLADGLDGLAGGTTFLCLCAVALLLSSVGDQPAGTALCLAFAGAVLGFLRFNTYPASVFMGDAGSQLLGFTIGVLSIRATQSAGSPFSAALPVLLLALPILDTLSVMAQRLGEGRSPFSADKNHIHHKLLALGFGHHEAVMVIYTLQAALFVAAYFLRFESDLTILAFVTTFFALAITALQLAERSGWQLRTGGGAIAESPLSRILKGLQHPKRLPWYSYMAIVAALMLYSALIVRATAEVTNDVRILIIALFAASLMLFAILRSGPLIVLEKATLYVTAAVLVYLDTALPADRLTSILTWFVIGMAAAATALRLRLHNDRRFQATPLDLIVLFMALIVPSLPGTLTLPHGGVPAIAKLVILFYAIEVLVSRSDGRAVWVRVGMVSVLAGLALRPLIPI
jgi:UDP-GlcNAc:undecaprenyl-phosphate GlcNAc-1-phosphate transferase